MSTGFRLGVVLRLRELAEDAAQAALARALQVHRSALDALRRSHGAAFVEHERATALQRASGHGGATVAGDLADAVASVELAEEAIVASEARVVAASNELLESRSRLAEASRRRQVVERLRDRTAAAERLRLQRREDATLNEVATTRHAWAALEEGGR
jgi:flagellar export protein FliJ